MTATRGLGGLDTRLERRGQIDHLTAVGYGSEPCVSESPTIETPSTPIPTSTTATLDPAPQLPGQASVTCANVGR
jgi:hypothetical protein